MHINEFMFLPVNCSMKQNHLSLLLNIKSPDFYFYLISLIKVKIKSLYNINVQTKKLDLTILKMIISNANEQYASDVNRLCCYYCVVFWTITQYYVFTFSEQLKLFVRSSSRIFSNKSSFRKPVSVSVLTKFDN